MPTSLVGLALFVVLLAPGMCYRWHRSVRRPVKKVSELRELASVTLVSVVSDAIALALFGVWRSARPGLAPDVGRLVRDPGAYVAHAYVPVATWAAGLLALACVVGLALAAFAEAAALDGSAASWVVRVARGRPGDIAPEPAWWRMFANRPEELVYAGCELDDGNYVGGYVAAFSAEWDETADRELVLTDPEIRDASGEMQKMGSSAVVVSARRLQFVTVTYVPVADATG